MKDSKRWKKIVGLILVVIIALGVLFLRIPLYYQARSYTAMYAYSLYEKNSSLLKEQKISLKIPGGLSTPEKDWYPFVMVFNDNEGFSKYIGRDLSLTILYNFGAFSWEKSSSTFFLDDSPYLGGFYGGYIVKENTGENKYGFTSQGQLNIDDIFAVSKYDYKYLVLQSLGCPEDQLTMDVLSYDTTKDVEYAGYKGWQKIDAFMLLNSPDHKFKGNRKAYIQYGNPLKQVKMEDFRLVTAHARVYVRYFEEYKSTVFLYIITPGMDTLETCDKQILSKTILEKKI